MVHELDISANDYARMASGDKTFHVAFDGSNYQRGDTIFFREPEGGRHTPGKSLTFELGYIDQARGILSLLRNDD